MKYGLIGHPVSHSKSPLLFKAAYNGRDDMTYDLIDRESFEDAFKVFMDGYQGINVTAPFKEEAFRKADVADTISRELLAVNILTRKDGRLYGYNSDFWAIRDLLVPFAQENPRSKVLVVGCGGAAKAAALAALKLKLHVTVANRNYRKACDFCFTGAGMTPMRLDQAPSYIDYFKAVIYAVPVKVDFAELLPADKGSPALSGASAGGRIEPVSLELMTAAWAFMDDITSSIYLSEGSSVAYEIGRAHV